MADMGLTGMCDVCVMYICSFIWFQPIDSSHVSYFTFFTTLLPKKYYSVAEIDPMYEPPNDQTDLSSAGGTFGDQTQKSKFSTLGSILTPGIMTHGEQSTYAEDFEAHLAKNAGKRSSSSHREQIMDIYAPGGKLGVVIDTPNDGAPVVHNIKETCPIKDQLRVGDALLAVDDEDVRSMTAIKVSKLISQKSNNSKRKFTILRLADDSA